MALDPRLMEMLRCPACREGLRELPDGTGLECSGCRKIYPIVDGIPVLLVDRALPPRG